MRNPGVRVSSFLGCKKIIKKAQIKKTHSWHKQPTVLDKQTNWYMIHGWSGAVFRLKS